MSNDIHQLFDRIWESYLSLAPNAKKIRDLFCKHADHPVINDHIALRTFNLSKIDLDVLAAPFLKLGYHAKGQYQFPARKLYARHFEHNNPELPKIFISELLTEKLSGNSASIIEKLVAQVDDKKVESADFCHSGRHWDINIKDYNHLLEESEYAAWIAAHGYQANHFTVSINHLDSYKSIEQVNKKILSAGFKMNEVGGLIKGSPSVLLEQSSTLADHVQVRFSDGYKEIPGCFYEFAKRYPMADGHLYQGFVSASADKIFSSTDTK